MSKLTNITNKKPGLSGVWKEVGSLDEQLLVP